MADPEQLGRQLACQRLAAAADSGELTLCAREACQDRADARRRPDARKVSLGSSWWPFDEQAPAFDWVNAEERRDDLG